MLGAALLAKKAVEKGLTRKPWVKTTLAPGSKVVTDYYDRAGLTPYLDKLGFNLVGYGCTTCIGNSGPAARGGLGGGQRGRPRRRRGALGQPQLRGPHQPRRQDELPGLPAAGGRLRARRLDGRRLRSTTPLGTDPDGNAGLPARHLAHRRRRSRRSIDTAIDAARCSPRTTPTSSPATSAGSRCRPPTGNTFEWDAELDLRPQAPVLRGHAARPAAGHRHRRRAGAGQARRLGDHRPHLPGRLDQGRLAGRQVPRRARRRAARLQLLRLAPRQPRGDDPRHLRQHPAAQPAARRAPRAASPATSPGRRAGARHLRRLARTTRRPGIPLVVLAGKEYGSGSSRDWAAKGTALLGVRAVIAESYERIHRSNLIGMGVLPLQFPEGAERRLAGPDRRGDVLRSPASPRSTTAPRRGP